MENRLFVEVTTERPMSADLTDNAKLDGFVQYLVNSGYVVPGSVEIDPASGKVKFKATEALIQYAEKYLK